MPKNTKTSLSRSKRATSLKPKADTKTAANRSHVQLVVRARELDAMKQALLYVQSLPPAEKEAWMRSNGEHMSLAFEQFVHVSTDTLRQAVFDDEAMQLSYELVQELKVTEQLVQQVFGDPTILSS